MPFDHGVLMPWCRRPQPSRLTTLHKITKPRPTLSFLNTFFLYGLSPSPFPNHSQELHIPTRPSEQCLPKEPHPHPPGGKSNCSKSSLPCQESFYCSGILIPQRKCVFPNGENCYAKGKVHPSNECRLSPKHVHSPWQEVHVPGKSQLPSEARAFLSHSSCLRPSSCISLNTYTTCTWQITCQWASAFRFIS
jgi:hypothetical protein